MLLHYIGKFNSSNLLQILKNANKKILFLKTLSFSAHNLDLLFALISGSC